VLIVGGKPPSILCGANFKSYTQKKRAKAKKTQSFGMKHGDIALSHISNIL